MRQTEQNRRRKKKRSNSSLSSRYQLNKETSDFHLSIRHLLESKNNQAEQISPLNTVCDTLSFFHYLFDLICSTNYQVECDDIDVSMIKKTSERKRDLLL